MPKPNIIFLGPLPPPYMGPSVATQILLNSGLKEKFELIHLDTTDRRDLKTLGVIDIQNIYLAIKHYFILTWLIITRSSAMVYIPISQTTIGYSRDAGFIIIAKLLGRKVICQLRGGNFKNWYESASPMMRLFVRCVHSFVDGQIVLGESLRHLFSGITPEEIVFVVPNGGNFEIKMNQNRITKKIRILYLSNFIRTKGILELLRAIPDVYSYYPDIEVCFAGNWRDEGTKIEFQNLLKKNPNLPVVLKGSIYGKDKFELLASSDIFVYPTYYPPEGHPWVIVEAMAAGLPIISTDQGAITESVIDGVNGFIVDKQNSQQIAEKVNILLGDSQIRVKMGAESRRMYLEKFTEEKMVERMIYAFNSVLGK
jgi:glycosyltransferase involved in cell wall biosynthesis